MLHRFLNTNKILQLNRPKFVLDDPPEKGATPFGSAERLSAILSEHRDYRLELANLRGYPFRKVIFTNEVYIVLYTE